MQLIKFDVTSLKSHQQVTFFLHNFISNKKKKIYFFVYLSDHTEEIGVNNDQRVTHC